MADGLCFRTATNQDAHGISLLIRRVFTADIVAGWGVDALANVHEESIGASLLNALAASAFQRVVIAREGVVAYINFTKPHLLAVLAVTSDLQGQGIGSRLIVEAIAEIDRANLGVEVLQVNATENSMPFYAKHGFFPITPMLNVEDRRFIRMALWLRPRRMGWLSNEPA